MKDFERVKIVEGDPHFAEIFTVPAKALSAEYREAVMALVGRTNDKPFKGMPTGHVVFCGARFGSDVDTTGRSELILQWARYEPCAFGIAGHGRVGLATVRCYESGDFSQLGIGT